MLKIEKIKKVGADIAKLRCKLETADPILQVDTSQLEKSLEEAWLKLNKLYRIIVLPK